MVKNYVAFRRCYGYLGKVLMQNTTRKVWRISIKAGSLDLAGDET